MSTLDSLLPPDSQPVLALTRRYTKIVVAPRVLDLDARPNWIPTDLVELDELGLTSVLSTDELGTPAQRQSLLLALGRDLGQTDAGVGMALLVSGLTESALGDRTGFGLEIERPAGRGAVVVTAGQRSVVLVDESGRGRRVTLEGMGSPLLGLRLGGGRLLERLPAAGEALSREALVALRLDLCLAAVSVAVGVATGSLQTAASYAEERYQGGTVIARHHAVDRMLRDMADHIAHAETLIVTLQSDLTREGWPNLLTQAFDACEAAITDGVQVLGGYGYMREYGQEKRMRDAKTLRLLFGSCPSDMTPA